MIMWFVFFTNILEVRT